MLAHLFKKGTFSPVNFYLGLSKASPGETAIGSNCQEMPNLGNYQRVSTPPATWRVVGGIADNVSEIQFPAASADWTVIATHFFLTNSGTYGAGYVYMYGALDITRDVHQAQIPKFKPYSVIFDLD